MKKKPLKIGKVSLGSVVRIVLAVSDIENYSLIKKAKAGGADILELRLDLCGNTSKDDTIKAVKKIKKQNLGLLGTIRSKKEGGKWSLSEEKRLELFEAVIPLVDAVDIELSSVSILNKVIKKAKAKRKKVIVSYHNFKSVPSDSSLKNIICKAKNAGADIVKIAALAKSRNDTVRLFGLTRAHKDKNLITIAMGEKGSVSRVVFPLAGSLLTYTYIGKPLASGQIPLDKLRRQLKLLYPKLK